MTLLERLDERWERMDGSAARKIDRILKDRREATTEIKRLRAALETIADPKNRANFRAQVFAKSIIDPELEPYN